MRIFYQGASVETPQKTVAAFLAANGIDGAAAIVEYDGEVYAPGADLASVAIRENASLDVFKLAAGG